MKSVFLASLFAAACAAPSAPSDPPPPPDEPNPEECPWTTSTGRRSCGAKPPAHRAATPHVARWLPLSPPMSMVTAGDSSETRLVWAMGQRIDFRDHSIAIVFNGKRLSQAKQFEIVLGDAALANAFRFSLTSVQGQSWFTDGERATLTLSWAGYKTTGFPDRSRISDAMVRLVDNGGAPIEIAIEGIGLVPEPAARFPRGVASFTFDDNYASMIDVAAPMLDARDLNATAYVIVEHVGADADHATLDQLRDRHDRGWEIAAHSMTLEAHQRRWTSLSRTALEDDIVDNRAWIMKHGFTGYDHCAYPGGELGTDTDVLDLTRKYFTSCRTIYQRQRETLPAADAHKLRVLYFTPAMTLAAAKAAIDNAVAAREWIILVFHRICEGPPTLSTEWSRADFSALIDHVASTGIAVQPVGAVLAP